MSNLTKLTDKEIRWKPFLITELILLKQGLKELNLGTGNTQKKVNILILELEEELNND